LLEGEDRVNYNLNEWTFAHYTCVEIIRRRKKRE